MSLISSHPSSLSCRKIYAFFKEGLIANADKKAAIAEKYQFLLSGSFDEEKIDRVCVNYISHTANIGLSLYNAANGGFAIVAEERKTEIEEKKRITQKFIENHTNEIEAEIDRLVRQAPFLSREMILSAAVNPMVNADQNFKEALSRRVHRTALFVINIPSKTIVEGHIYEDIPPSSIEKVLLHEEMRSEIESNTEYFAAYADKICYLPTHNFSFEYGYKLESGNFVHIRLKDISGPDYENALKLHVGKATHMTTLF